MNSKRYAKKRVIISNIICVISTLFALLGLIILFWILIVIIFKGMAGFSFDIFIEPTSFGGLANAFLGQLQLVFVASVIGIPIGLLAGIYLSEYSTNVKIANCIRNISDIMTSIPSIIIGVFAYAILVKPAGTYSGWSGSFALAIMMIPIVLKTTDDMLGLVSQSIREASFALGATKYKCIIDVVFKSAKNGLITGIILSIARVCGETAPLLFTSSNNDFFGFNMNESISSLTVSIFDFSQMPDEHINSIAWAGAFILSMFILLINVLSRVFIKK